MLDDIFRTLGLREDDTKAYLYLLERGALSAGKLSKIMRMPRTTLYGYLDRLQDMGLVSQTVQSGVKIFTAESLEKVDLLYQRKIEKMRQGRQELVDLMPLLQNQYGVSLHKPRVQFYEGEQGLQTILEDMLLYSDIETYALWPIENMMDMMTEEFTHFHNTERIKRQISIKVIWPNIKADNIEKWPYLSVGDEFLREARTAPTDVDFKMGYWVYDNKVAFISSREEAFGFTIESVEFVNLVKMQFNLIWDISKPFEFKARGANVFLDDMDGDD